MDRTAPFPTMSEADRAAHAAASYIRRPVTQSDELLRLAKEADAKAAEAGTLRPVPSGISRPLLSMAGA